MPLARDACPVCGRELVLPRHRPGAQWTKAELLWARKLLHVGLQRKVVAGLIGVSPRAMESALCIHKT